MEGVFLRDENNERRAPDEKQGEHDHEPFLGVFAFAARERGVARWKLVERVYFRNHGHQTPVKGWIGDEF